MALDASRVDYLDSSRERLAIAERLGANAIDSSGDIRQLSGSHQLLREGYPVSVDGSGAAGALQFAIRALSAGGVCTTVAFYLRAVRPYRCGICMFMVVRWRLALPMSAPTYRRSSRHSAHDACDRNWSQR